MHAQEFNVNHCVIAIQGLLVVATRGCHECDSYVIVLRMTINHHAKFGIDCFRNRKVTITSFFWRNVNICPAIKVKSFDSKKQQLEHIVKVFRLIWLNLGGFDQLARRSIWKSKTFHFLLPTGGTQTVTLNWNVIGFRPELKTHVKFYAYWTMSVKVVSIFCFMVKYSKCYRLLINQNRKLLITFHHRGLVSV